MKDRVEREKAKKKKKVLGSNSGKTIKEEKQ
jgi:hypothetical protein